jgi:hypothetical protein
MLISTSTYMTGQGAGGNQGGPPLGAKHNVFFLEGIKTYSVNYYHPLVTDPVWLFFVAKSQSELPISQGVRFDGPAESIKNLPGPSEVVLKPAKLLRRIPIERA